MKINIKKSTRRTPDTEIDELPTIQQLEHGRASQENIVEESELGASLKELNKTTIDKENRVSEIDLRTRLCAYEISGMLAIETLVGFRVMSLKCLEFTMRKKRMNVSLGGMGRQEIVSIVQGKQEQDINKAGGRIKQGIMNVAGMGVKK